MMNFYVLFSIVVFVVAMTIVREAAFGEQVRSDIEYERMMWKIASQRNLEEDRRNAQ